MTNLVQVRRKLERQKNIKLLASIVDWTVALYMVLPGVIIGFFLYKDFATHVQTLWVAHVPLIMWIVLLFFVTRMPTIRTYLQRADRLFLIQDSKQMIQLKQAGFTWTLTKHLCRIVVYLALLAPIFIKVHHLTIPDFLLYLLLLFTTSFGNALVHLRIQSKWLQLCLSVVIWITGIALFLYAPPVGTVLICTILVIFNLMYYQRHYVLDMKHYEQLVELDQGEFYKWQSTIFKTAPELRSQLAPKMKIPRILWKNSQRMFSHADYFIEELVCKTMLRNSQYKWGYLRFLLTGLGLILVVPGWAKFVLLALLFVALRTYMRSIMQETFEHKIWAIFQVAEEQKQRAIAKLIKGFVDLPLLFICIMLVIYMSQN